MLPSNTAYVQGQGVVETVDRLDIEAGANRVQWHCLEWVGDQRYLDIRQFLKQKR